MNYIPIFEKSELHDYKIVCIDGEIPVHKLVLLDNSKYVRDNAGDTEIKVPFPVEQVLPVVRYMYGFIYDLRGKYNIFGAADLFQLTFRYRYMNCIEQWILFDSFFDARSAARVINRLDEHTLTTYLNIIVLLLVSCTKVSFGISVNSDNMFLAKLPVQVLKEYLNSDFLHVDDEMHIARFLHYYELVTEKPIPEELRQCLRTEYYGRNSNAIKYFYRRNDPIIMRFDRRPRLCQLMQFETRFLKKYKNAKTTHDIALTHFHTSGNTLWIPSIGIYPSLGKYIETEERLAVLNYILKTSMTLDTTTPYENAKKSDDKTPFPSDDDESSAESDSTIDYMSD